MADATEALVLLARVRAGEADAARAAIQEHWPRRRTARSPRPAERTSPALQVLTPPGAVAPAARPASTSCSPPTSTRRSHAWLERLRAAARRRRSTPSSATAPSTPAPRSPPRSCAGSRPTGSPVGFSVIGSPGATLAEVDAALDLRDRARRLRRAHASG